MLNNKEQVALCPMLHGRQVATQSMLRNRSGEGRRQLLRPSCASSKRAPRVLGLVQTGKPKRARCTQPQTVVVQDNDCRERGCLDHT